MGKSKRRKRTAEFKAKVAIEALREQSTLSELSSKYELSQAQISCWKAEFLKNAAAAFGGSTERTEKDIQAERDRCKDNILQSDGNWHPVSSATAASKKAVILPFRAFLLPSTHNANASISMELEDAYGIETIETIDADGTEHYYDLQGRQLSGKPAKGVYINNGKKIVIKYE